MYWFLSLQLTSPQPTDPLLKIAHELNWLTVWISRRQSSSMSKPPATVRMGVNCPLKMSTATRKWMDFRGEKEWTWRTWVWRLLLWMNHWFVNEQKSTLHGQCQIRFRDYHCEIQMQISIETQHNWKLNINNDTANLHASKYTHGVVNKYIHGTYWCKEQKYYFKCKNKTFLHHSLLHQWTTTNIGVTPAICIWNFTHVDNSDGHHKQLYLDITKIIPTAVMVR